MPVIMALFCPARVIRFAININGEIHCGVIPKRIVVESLVQLVRTSFPNIIVSGDIRVVFNFKAI